MIQGRGQKPPRRLPSGTVYAGRAGAQEVFFEPLPSFRDDGARERLHVPRGVSQVEATAANQRRQRAAAHQFHRDEIDGGVGVDLMDRDDVRMVQRRPALASRKNRSLRAGPSDAEGGRTFNATSEVEVRPGPSTLHASYTADSLKGEGGLVQPEFPEPGCSSTNEFPKDVTFRRTLCAATHLTRTLSAAKRGCSLQERRASCVDRQRARSFRSSWPWRS